MPTPSPSFDYLSIISSLFEIKNILLFFIYISTLLFTLKLLKTAAEKISRKIPSKRFRIAQITTILTFVLHLGGSFYIFYTLLSPPRELLLALLGSATVAIGLALKDIVASLISGITLILDPPFQIGDKVQFKEIYGDIQHIGLRAVRITT